MRECIEDSEKLHKRISKIIGQIQAVDRMIDQDVSCEDIITQINAAKSALHKCGQVVFEDHLNYTVKQALEGVEGVNADKVIKSYAKAVERFGNIK